eukprot:COSAG02_NODE_8343_length_2606_cov_1.232948_4_plen_128_part_00
MAAVLEMTVGLRLAVVLALSSICGVFAPQGVVGDAAVRPLNLRSIPLTGWLAVCLPASLSVRSSVRSSDHPSLSLCVCVSLSLSVSLRVYIYVSILSPVCLSVSVSRSLCLCLCLCLHSGDGLLQCA